MLPELDRQSLHAVHSGGFISFGEIAVTDMAISSVTVQKATGPGELEQVFSIRRIVFVEEQHCPVALEYEHEEVSTHFLATCEGVPAGAARWRRTDKGYKLERFAVLKHFRGRGVGKALVLAVLADLPATARPVYLHAQLTAVDFYRRLGFVPEGDVFEEAGILHTRMIR